MKKIIYFLFVIIPLLCSAQGQDIYYNELPNFFNAESKGSFFKTEFNFNLGNKQIQASYNISDDYFVYGTYNYNNSKTESRGFFGDVIFDENKNSGYSFGFGHQGFGKIGNYGDLEVLVGFEKQNYSVVSYFATKKDLPNRQEEYLRESYFKVFSQFNMIKIRRNFDAGFSLKLSYFKFLENPLYGNATNVFFTPSYSFNYKILKNKSLILTSQFGLSIPTNNFMVSNSSNGFTTSQSEYILGGIIKFGIQYNFKAKGK